MSGKLRAADAVNDASRAEMMRRTWTSDHQDCLFGDEGDRWQRRAATFDTSADRWWLTWRNLRLAHD